MTQHIQSSALLSYDAAVDHSRCSALGGHRVYYSMYKRDGCSWARLESAKQEPFISALTGLLLKSWRKCMKIVGSGVKHFHDHAQQE